MNLILFEDEHLLVVNKPAGWNTHAPSPFAGEGIYEWLKNREPKWANLAIIHRLDKETSGILVFGKSPVANRSLTNQFAKRFVHKKYFLLTDREISFQEFVAKSLLTRAGEKYCSAPTGEQAVTRFRRAQSAAGVSPAGARISDCRRDAGSTLIEAEPLTGRTHQIRVHAAENGFPIVGDSLYGGTSAARVCLHAAEISFEHPATGKKVSFTAPPDFSADARLALRTSLIDSSQTNAFRLVHGAADGWPGFYVDLLGEFLLAQSEKVLSDEEKAFLGKLMKKFSARGVYHKFLRRKIQRASPEETSPQLVLGEKAPDEILIRENGIQFALRFDEGYSVGIFLDQRENRRRLLTNYIAPEFVLNPVAAVCDRRIISPGGHRAPLQNLEVLNTFAYTCAFSLWAAQAGAQVTSLDLSKKYLDWGQRNFSLNSLDPAKHDFIFGDAFDWFKRLAKRKRQFDVILLDPPTFSRSKEHGVFQVEKNYGELVFSALPLLKSNGLLFASTNAADLKPERFLEQIHAAVAKGGRKILQEKFFPQPPDFPIHREEPAYLKTVWLRVG